MIRTIDDFLLLWRNEKAETLKVFSYLTDASLKQAWPGGRGVHGQRACPMHDDHALDGDETAGADGEIAEKSPLNASPKELANDGRPGQAATLLSAPSTAWISSSTWNGLPRQWRTPN